MRAVQDDPGTGVGVPAGAAGLFLLPQDCNNINPKNSGSVNPIVVKRFIQTSEIFDIKSRK